MKNALISFVLAIFFVFVLFYLIDNTSPWNIEVVNANLEKYNVTSAEEFDVFVSDMLNLGLIWSLLDISNLVLLASALFGSIFFGFSSIHLFVDKLFFKKFYQQANLFLAFRRAFLITSAILFIFWLKLIGALLWYNVVAVITVALSLEYFFISNKKSTIEKQE